MNDEPEVNVEPNPKTSRGQRVRGWVSRQSKLRLGLIGVMALALAAGTWTGVSYANDGTETAAPKPSATTPGPDSQLLSPEPHPSTPPKEKETEKEKKKKTEKPKSEPTQEEKTEEPVAAGCEDFSGNQLTACKMLDDFSFESSEMDCLSQLWDHESGWNHQAANPSGAYGIPQALPGDKMASAGSDWNTNPATQIEWGLGYISDRYGTPCGAWGFWQSNNYY